jgi:hypothetical protein
LRSVSARTVDKDGQREAFSVVARRKKVRACPTERVSCGKRPNDTRSGRREIRRDDTKEPPSQRAASSNGDETKEEPYDPRQLCTPWRELPVLPAAEHATAIWKSRQVVLLTTHQFLFGGDHLDARQ